MRFLWMFCRLKKDGSVRNKRADTASSSNVSLQEAACWLPAELESPVLRGREGLLEVARLLTALNTLPVEVNGTTGLHVHVSGVAGTVDQEVLVSSCHALWEPRYI
jgi:hypothetical protein